MMEKVSLKRLCDELTLILKEEKPLRQIKRIQELVGFNFVHPCLTSSRLNHKLLSSIKSEIKRFETNYPKRRPIDAWLIYFMGLIDSLNINDSRAVCKKFSFRRGDEKRILSYKKISDKFISELKKPKLNLPKSLVYLSL